MNAKELAKALGTHSNTVYNWIRNGSIEAIKEGRSFEIPQHEVNRLLAQHNESDIHEVNKEAAYKLIADYETTIQSELWILLQKAGFAANKLKEDGYNDLPSDDQHKKALDLYKSDHGHVRMLFESFNVINQSEQMINSLREKVEQLDSESMENMQDRQAELNEMLNDD